MTQVTSIISRFFIPVLVLAFALISVTATAQKMTRVDVRVSENDGYDRVVFDVTGNSNYELSEGVSEEGESYLTFSMSSAAVIDLNGYRDDPGRYVRDMEIMSPLNQPLSVKMSLYQSSRVRNFKVGNRIIVDVYEPTDAAARLKAKTDEIDRQVEEKKAEETKEEETKAEAEAEPEPEPTPAVEAETEAKPVETEEVKEEEAAEPTEGQVGEAMTQPEQAAKEAAADEAEKSDDGEAVEVVDDEGVAEEEELDAEAEAQAQELLGNLPGDAHAVTFTATQPFGMAAYERYGRVWFVIDNPDLTILPQLLGPEIKKFGRIEKYSFPGGQAFSFVVPQGLAIRAEGGGLYWRYVMAPVLGVDDRAVVSKELSGGEFANGEVSIAMPDAAFLVRLPDPLVGDALAVVTVSRATMPQSLSMSFVDIDLLPSFAGAVIRPKSDGLRIQIDQSGEVLINRENGLTLSEGFEEFEGEFLDGRQAVLPDDRIYNFLAWSLGDRRPFADKAALIHRELQDLAAAEAMTLNREASVALLIRAGKFYLANAMPQEALGYLRMARQIAPELRQSPEFASVRGAAYALSSYLRQARRDLNHPGLDEVDEVKLWRAYIYARYTRLDEAYETLPVDLTALLDYPVKIRSELAFAFAEVASHAGDAEMMATLMDMIEENKKSMSTAMHQGVDYYRAQAALTRNLPAEAYALLETVEETENPYYGTKAGFARITDQLERELMSPIEGLEQLERLRYAWRGDKMEALILETLGRLYIDNNMPHKGLTTLRQAVSQIRDRNTRNSMTAIMTEAFVDLFTGEGAEQLSALEAVTMYEEFQELTPPGEDGDRVMLALVDRLVEVDLLDRAVSILRNLADTRQEGEDAEQSILRLSSILLMNRKADQSLQALEGMDERFGEAVIQQPPPVPEIPVFEPEPVDPSITPAVRRRIIAQQKEAWEAEQAANPPEPAPIIEPEPQNPLHLKREILKARALSDLNRHGDALAILNIIPDAGAEVLRLKADTAWRAGEWAQAATSFADVLNNETVGDALSISKEHQAIILNRAIALSLSGDTAGLAALREEYSPEMASSPLYQSFQIITRPQRNGALADRETLLSLMAEVDLFGQFLSPDE